MTCLEEKQMTVEIQAALLGLIVTIIGLETTVDWLAIAGMVLIIGSVAKWVLDGFK